MPKPLIPDARAIEYERCSVTKLTVVELIPAVADLVKQGWELSGKLKWFYESWNQNFRRIKK